MSLHTLAWLLTGATLVHNLEESIWLPDWTRRAKRFPRPIGKVEFLFGAAMLSGLTILATAAANISRPESCAVYIVAGIALAVMLNAIVPHLVLTLYERSYMPGTGSAMLLNFPLGCLLLERALVTRQIRATTLYWAGPCVVLAMVALMPFLLYLGHRMAARCP